MTELFEAAFSEINVVYTTLLILVLIYWCIVILGVIDVDAFDWDADVSGGAGGEGPSGAESGDGAFSWLAFFNVGEVPIMFFISIVALTMWVVSIQINEWLDGIAAGWVADHRGLVAAMISVPNLIFALFLAKFLLVPVKRMRTRKPHRTRLEGKTCLITSLEANETFGRGEMPKRDGSLILNVRTRSGEVLKKGDAAEISEQVIEGDVEYYVVTKKVWEE